MHFDPCPQLPDPSSELQDLEPDRVELGPRPRGSLQIRLTQGMQQHISHGMNEEAELVGLEAMTGSPIGAKMGLVVLDHQFHPSSLAVDHFIEEAPGSAFQIRHHEPEVRTQSVVFGLDDDPAVFSPAFRPVGKPPEETDRLPLSLETFFSLFDQGGRLPAQHRRHQLPALALVEVDRKITILIEKGVEQSPLLMTVSDILDVVDVQHDRNRRSPVRLDERIGQDLGDAVKTGARDGVLQTREPRLAGQRRILGKLLAGHLQGRVVPQRVRIVGILVAAGDLEDPLFEHVQERMPGIAGMAAIVQNLGDAVEKLQAAFNFPKEEHAGVGRDFAARKVEFELFFLEVFKKKPFGGMMNFV